MEAIQQQSFPITEARVISAAAPPQFKSAPRTSIVLGIAGAVGLLLSFGAAFLRESFDRVFRTPRQVETSLHTHCLAVLQRLADPKSSDRKPLAPSRPGGAKEPGQMVPLAKSSPVEKNPAQKVLVKPALRSSISGEASTSGAPRSLVPGRPFLRHVVAEPLSTFAEAFRSIKVAADVAGSHVIGITSTLPGEGKSTISSNLGELIAHTGKRIILLDGDLRNPSLTRGLTPKAKVGLLEVLNGELTLEEALYIDEETGLRFLPTVVTSHLDHTNEVLASDTFKAFADGLRKDHDYVIIDLSPVAPVVDVRATTHIVDSYIYVIEWGQTQVKLVQHQLSSFPELYDRLLGVVLNKADVRVLARYETYYGSYHYKNYYGGQNPYLENAS
jgi:succinoglycan biosynthesis transport protein ExoP